MVVFGLNENVGIERGITSCRSSMNPYHLEVHQYSKLHTKDWSEKVASLDAYIFVYARIQPCHLGAVKERNRFSFHDGTTSSGILSGMVALAGVRAVENLRLVMAGNQDCGRASAGGPFDV